MLTKYIEVCGFNPTKHNNVQNIYYIWRTLWSYCKSNIVIKENWRRETGLRLVQMRETNTIIRRITGTRLGTFNNDSTVSVIAISLQQHFKISPDAKKMMLSKYLPFNLAQTAVSQLVVWWIWNALCQFMYMHWHNCSTFVIICCLSICVGAFQRLLWTGSAGQKKKKTLWGALSLGPYWKSIHSRSPQLITKVG